MFLVPEILQLVPKLVPSSGTSFLEPESGTGFWYVYHGHYGAVSYGMRQKRRNMPHDAATQRTATRPV